MNKVKIFILENYNEYIFDKYKNNDKINFTFKGDFMINIECKALVDALKGNYKGTYEKFEKEIIIYIKKCILFLNNYDNCIPRCLIKENLHWAGTASSTNLICINKKIIQELMNGKKDNLFVIFHELTHIEQFVKIKNGISTEEVIKYIKDILLDDYQKKENSRIICIDNMKSYFNLNYDIESSELDAYLNSIILTTEFLLNNNIDVDDEKIVKILIKILSKMDSDRYVGDIITFNSYYLSLEDAFDIAIKHHPEWIEMYPQLKTEYYIEDGIVVKNENPTYQEYDVNSDKYYQIRKMLKKNN